MTGSENIQELSLEQSNALHVVLLYKRGLEADAHVLRLLDSFLKSSGFEVFVDRHLLLGMEWAMEIEGRVCTADAVVALISEESASSEMMQFEIETARDCAQQSGRPRLLPVRVQYQGALEEPLAGILDPIQYFLWNGPGDDQRLSTELVQVLRTSSLPQPQPQPSPSLKGLRLLPRPGPRPKPAPPPPQQGPAWQGGLEPVGGAVPLHSPFYISRPADHELQQALTNGDSTVLIKGGRQIGKTSALARGLQFARERGARVALTDFQKFNAPNLDSIRACFVSMAESLADQLEINVVPSDLWEDRRGANVNFERFMRREILAKLNAPLVWGLDEVDRLFVTSYGSEVFGLFRSWHNERALDPSGPWAGLSLVIAYATEASLFITDMNQSPFNIGTKLTLEDFTQEQVGELNERYGSPLKGEALVRRFMQLVGGHPYLVRRGLQEIASKRISLDAFEDQAPRDEGPFGDHLRRILVLLAKDPALTDVVRGILQGQPCPNQESFWRLRTAGLITGESLSDVRMRCHLYFLFLARHLI